MVKKKKICPYCGKELLEYQNPVPTVDIIIDFGTQGIILIKRKNYPYGWALPGGFVDYGETVEEAAAREAKEETSLEVLSLRQFRVYSDPKRDPRQHTLSIVFIAQGRGIPRAADDADDLGIFTPDNLPQPIVFDHDKILQDYFQMKKCPGNYLI
ncbi:MAG TPA: NUDIX hydrolase [Thermodesulfobacteriota bacterium]|nr:NUDIX hydrolase [Thermodesulfobacteriota bacterium]